MFIYRLHSKSVLEPACKAGSSIVTYIYIHVLIKHPVTLVFI